MNYAKQNWQAHRAAVAALTSYTDRMKNAWSRQVRTTSAKTLKLVTTWMTTNGFDSVKDLEGAGDLSSHLGKHNK